MKTEMTTKKATPAAFGSVLVEALDNDRFFVMPEGLALRTGATGWRWPVVGVGVSWLTEQGASNNPPDGATEEQIEAGPEFYDSRLTIQEVARLVAKAEREAYLRLNDIPACDATAYAAGAWDEYLAPTWGIDESRAWPDDCYVKVCVVPGGNEGLALRVETCDEKNEMLLTGKSFGSWQDCYESAARISAMLNH